MAHYNDMSFLGAEAPNVNHATGIRYGFISQHEVMPDALDEITRNGRDLTYEGAVEEARATLRDALDKPLDDLGIINLSWDKERAKERLRDIVDNLWDEIEQEFNDKYESDGSHYLYEQDGYRVEYMSDGDLAVTKSPYYALRGLCSPCGPNAGHLTTEGDYKVYCLGHDWFEDGKAPYDVYSVETGEKIEPTNDETPSRVRCAQCGEPMFCENGVAYHGEPDAINHDADADHVAINDKNYGK